MFSIIARRDGQEVVRRSAPNCAAADKVFAEVLIEHRHCDVTMCDGNAVLVAVGPRPPYPQQLAAGVEELADALGPHMADSQEMLRQSARLLRTLASFSQASGDARKR